MSMVGALHAHLVFQRRVRVLAGWFARLLPPDCDVLDVGCGDGLIASLLQQRRADLRIRGLDVLPREQSHIPVALFDGSRIPFPDASVDAVLFSDVLHHTADPGVLLAEARRVARRCIVIKDHFLKGVGAGARLRFMDWLGNARFGVALPYNYWSEPRWRSAWSQLCLTPEACITHLGLYPVPADWLFGAGLHFICRLTPAS